MKASCRPKKSDVWKFFEIDQDDESRAVCKLCLPVKITISRGSKIKGPQSYGTSALWAHLRLGHKREYSSLEKCPVYPSKLPKKTLRNHTVSQQHVSVTPKLSQYDISLPNTSKALEFNLSNLQNSYIYEPAVVISSENEKHLNKIGEMIAADNQPITIVEEKGFKKLMKALAPSLDLMGSTYFGEYILPHIYDKIKEKIQVLLNEIESLSLTVDIERLPNENLLTVTAHGINSQFEVVYYILNTTVLPTYPSQKIMNSILEHIMNAWSLDRSRVLLVMQEHWNQRSNAEFVDQMGIQNEIYFNSLMHQTVEEALLSHAKIKNVLETCLQISNLADFGEPDVKHKSQTNLKLPRYWRTMYNALVKLKSCPDYSSFSSSNDSSIVEEIIAISESFIEISENVSPTKNFISNVIPYVATMIRYLNSRQSNGGDFSVKEIVRNGISQTFYAQYKIEERKSLSLATALDPRYKLSFFSEETKPVIKIWLMEELQEMNEEDQPPPIKMEDPDIWNCFDQIVEETTPTSSFCISEVDKYVNTNLIPRNGSPLLWWKENELYFPQLSKLAKKYLSAPMESAYNLHKNTNLVNRLKTHIEEDKKAGSLLDISERLFMHHNLNNITLEDSY